jgi:hypothetical protein
MSEGGKNLKFQFVLDATSFQQVKRALNELLAVSQQLGKSLSGVSLLGQGSTGILGPDGRPISSGASGVSQSRVTGASTSMAKVVLENANAFKNLATSGSASLRGLSDALKRSVGEQGREVDNLQRKLTGLEAKYRSAKEAATASPGNARLAARAERYQYLEVKRAEQHEKAKEKLGIINSLVPSETGPSQTPLAPPATTGQGPSRLLGMLGMLGGGMLGSLATLGPAAVAVIAAKTVLREVTQGSLDPSRIAAERGQLAGQVIMPQFRGDVRGEIARSDILSDPTKRRAYEDQGSMVQRFVGTMGALTRLELRKAWSGEAAALHVRSRREEMVELERAANPLEQEVLGGMQDYRSNLSRLRALGIGARKDESGYATIARHRSRSGLTAFSEEEEAAAFQALQATGTRQAAYELKGGVLSAQAGGLRSAANIAGLMSRFGSRAGESVTTPGGVKIVGGMPQFTAPKTSAGRKVNIGRDFLDAVRVAGGAGGLDVSTANLLGEFVAQQQAQFGVGTGEGQGLGMLGMMMAGTGGERGLAAAHQNIKGLKGLEALTSGNIDPYQKARNLQIAIGTGAKGIAAQDYLASMSMTQLAERGVTGIAGALGITEEQKKQQLRGMTTSLSERILKDPTMAGTRMSQVMESIRASGKDPTTWFQEGGWKEFGKGEKGKTLALEAYGAALRSTKIEGASTEAEALGMSRLILEGMGAGPATTKGRKVSDVGGGGVDATVAAAHAKVQAEASEKLVGKTFDVVRAFEALVISIGITESAFGKDAKEREVFLKDMEQSLADVKAGKGPVTRSAVDARYRELQAAKYAPRPSSGVPGGRKDMTHNKTQ